MGSWPLPVLVRLRLQERKNGEEANLSPSVRQTKTRLIAFGGTRRRLRGSRDWLYVLRIESSSDTLVQHSLPCSYASQCSRKPALRCRCPNCCTELYRLGRTCLGRQHDPQSTHHFLRQWAENYRLFALGNVRNSVLMSERNHG
jgi:hypothetical protein